MRRLETGSEGRARLAPALAIVLGLAAVARAQGPDVDPATWARKPPAMAPSHRFGVTLQGPRYNPDGPLGPNILFDGARDAHRLGFRTLKIAMVSYVVNPAWKFYRLSDADMASARDLVDLAKLDVYRRTLALPFQTFIITADAIGEGACWTTIAAPGKAGQPRPVDRPLTDSQKSAMYWQIHDLAFYLLTTYKGTGKVFILQNHEGDWKLVPYPDARLEPSDVAIANAYDYFRLRQQAVDDARREAKAEGVYLYHCIEVNLVKKAMEGRRTVANMVLPRIDCDLVGYSAWDTAPTYDGSFSRAVTYLRSIARPSFAFGRNQVIITEIGARERAYREVVPALRSMLEATTLGSPWVVQWALYDNEATRMVDGKRVPVDDGAREEDCTGLWVRRPNGQFGQLFRAYRPYLVADPGGPEPTEGRAYVARAYRLLLAREPDPGAVAASTPAFEAAPWDKERFVRDLLTSPEYRAQNSGSSAAFVFDAYRALLGRNPDPAAVGLLSADFSADATRLAYLKAVQDSDEARRRYVDWLYRRCLGRTPTPAEVAPCLDLLARGGSRRQVYDQIATVPAR